MKKVILFSFYLILILNFFFIIPNGKFNILAANTTGICGEGCNYSYGEAVDPKAYPDGAVICPKSCPKCQASVYSSSGYDYEVCTEEDYEPEISDLGGEALTKDSGMWPGNNAICQGDSNCEECVNQGNAWSALGCLQTKSSQTFVNQILRIALGIAGGLAFLFMIFGSLQIILSTGNPDRVKAGKEIIIAALGGLFLIIFSIFILQIIGVDILGLKGFK